MASILDLIFDEAGAKDGKDEQKDVLRHPDSLCLSAGAGSGKTRTLVGKYIQLLVIDGRPPAEILAITFTEKAAAEMRLRIREALKELIARESDPQKCGELEEKLTAIGGGWISTIHSFGARVLREHPAEAGIDPSFAPLAGQDADELWESAAVAAILEQAERDVVVGELVFRLGLSGGRGRNLVSVLLSIKRQLESTGADPADLLVPDAPAASGAPSPAMLRNAIEAILGRAEPGATIQKKARDWQDLCAALTEPVPDAAGILRALTRAGWDEKTERLRPGGVLKKSEAEAFASVETTSRMLAANAADVCQQRAGSTLKRLTLSMWRHAESEKARRRALDFADLELKTLKLFETYPEITAAYQERFTHILVDEYQDVNAVQAKLVRILSGGRPRSLFAVGDPKQSIYLFRGADITQFQTLWTGMSERGAAFELKRNFRSHPRLVRAVNDFFDKRVFGGSPPVEMVPAKPSADPEGRPRIQWLNIAFDDARSSERREIESARIVAHISRLMDLPAGDVVEDRAMSFGDVALLFRATTSLYIYEETFRRAQIPYELVKSGTAFQSQEVLDCLNVLTVFTDPSDAVSWLGFLRSPMAGISDDGIFVLAKSGDIRNYFLENGPMPAGSSDADRQAVERARELYRRGSAERKIRTPLSLLDWLIAETGYGTILSGMPQPAARLRYIEALRTLAAQYGCSRPDPFTAFLETAWRMVDRREKESGSDSPDSDAVKLMTIHQAKGLEFPVVLLPDLLRPERNDTPDILVTRREGGVALSARVKLPGLAQAFATRRWTEDREMLAEGDHEEQKRLLYVAMTRAQDLLVLPGPDAQVRGHSIWELLYVFLKEEPRHVEVVETAMTRMADLPAPISTAGRLPHVRLAPATLARVYPSRRIVTPSSFAAKRPLQVRETKPRPRVERSAAYAVELGTLAHNALQHLDLSAPADRQAKQLDRFLKSRLRWTPIPAKPAEQLLDDLRNFLRSPMAERMRTERRIVRREYPFEMGLESGKPALFVRGKVDLLIAGGSSVEIYDYKYQPPMSSLGDYEGQLMAYALAACRAFDLTLVTVGLQFLMGDQALVRREVGADEAENILRRILSNLDAPVSRGKIESVKVSE